MAAAGGQTAITDDVVRLGDTMSMLCEDGLIRGYMIADG
jgi:hypothetical protein